MLQGNFEFSLIFPFFFLIVLFPFLTPVFEMLNISLFPKSTIDFFKKSIKRMKESRLQDKQKVNPMVVTCAYSPLIFY